MLMLYVDGGLRSRQLGAVRAACSLQCAAQATTTCYSASLCYQLMGRFNDSMRQTTSRLTCQVVTM